MRLPELTRKTTTPRAVDAPASRERNIFTVTSGQEKLALPVEYVHTIFRIARITPVPCGPKEVVGLANLRGKIVTVVSLRRRLGMPDAGEGVSPLAIGIEHLGESIALLVDAVGDVITVSEKDRIAAPPHLAPQRIGVTAAVYAYNDGILSVLDMDALFDFSHPERGGLNAPASEPTFTHFHRQGNQS